MKEAGGHAAGHRHGDSTSCCQLEGAYHTNRSLIFLLFFCVMEDDNHGPVRRSRSTAAATRQDALWCF
jgi:hypothetical protein